MEKLRMSVGVVEFVFSPDEAVEAFHPTRDAILSRGQGSSRTRRGRKPQRPALVLDDRVSIPDTEESWMYEQSDLTLLSSHQT
mmetsp:Transcript_178155/g.565481  ORF Transcript_178155/g.565481 Transcript_178155/m.565481 type:complete len:83 (+) Transcript_178155:177-425(+)